LAELRRIDKKIKSVTIKPIYDTTAAKYYMDVKNGIKDVQYLHEDLRPILKETYGVFTYQEQVMTFLVDIAGYSWEEADVIRGAIAKKKHEVIMATFDKIRKSCQERGWSKDAIETVCQQIQAFSRYSFNRSHSFAYGELGYITLYLKHHFPLEWWCSVLNNEDNSDKVRSYVVLLSDKISPPSLKNPQKIWTIKDGKLVTPVSALKGVGPSVVNELALKAPFANLEDFMKRIDHTRVNIGAMSILIKSRTADDIMDQSIPDYIERKKAFMDKYCSLKRTKTVFKPEMYTTDYLQMFLDEKDTNDAFNKNLLSTPEILNIITSKWKGLKVSGSKSIPLTLGDDEDRVYVISDISTGLNMLNNSLMKKDKKFAMIALFQESSYASGFSKKSGKPWQKLSVTVSDGFNTMEAVWWDRTKPLRFKKDSLVYIQGEFTAGWKTPLSMTIKEVVLVE